MGLSGMAQRGLGHGRMMMRMMIVMFGLNGRPDKVILLIRPEDGLAEDSGGAF